MDRTYGIGMGGSAGVEQATKPFIGLAVVANMGAPIDPQTRRTVARLTAKLNDANRDYSAATGPAKHEAFSRIETVLVQLDRIRRLGLAPVAAGLAFFVGAFHAAPSIELAPLSTAEQDARGPRPPQRQDDAWGGFSFSI